MTTRFLSALLTTGIIVCLCGCAGPAQNPTESATASSAPIMTTAPATSETQQSFQSKMLELESVIKSGDATALEPYVQGNLLTDQAAIHRKAQIVIESYQQYVAATGDNHLALASEQDPGQPEDKLISWQGDIDKSGQPNLAPRYMYASIDGQGQLKIRLQYNETLADYLPAEQVQCNGIILDCSRTISQADLQTFFGQTLLYKRGESSTSIFTQNKEQEHFFGENLLVMDGKDSQLSEGYGGFLIEMDLLEGPIQLDGQVMLGNSLQDVLSNWPLLEDFYQPERTVGQDRILLNDSNESYLFFTGGKLVGIHLQSFAD
jgi:hypothetical protein